MLYIAQPCGGEKNDLTAICRRVNVVFAIEVGVIYLSATIPDGHGDSAETTLTVAQNANGAPPTCSDVHPPLTCCWCC